MKIQAVQSINRIAAATIFMLAFVLFVATLAPSIVPGDPGEYQLIPHILGIAHPPGYAFFTILAKTWTSVVRIGSIAYRTNLLAAAAGAWTVAVTYGIVSLLWETGKTSFGAPENRDVIHAQPSAAVHNHNDRASTVPPWMRILPAIAAAAVLATSTDLWQHSIHANSHIVSAALSVSTLYAGLCWWATAADRWLYGFAFLAALGVTHHPLLAFGAPAYVTFVLAVNPRLLCQPRRIGCIVLAVLLGLSVFLYLPLRAGATPFGPSPTLDAIIGHATARGIRGNLFHFGLADQPVRARVFYELLRLQFTPLTLVLAVIGLIWLALKRPRPFILLALFFSINLAFIINTVQDVMAYLLLPFTTAAVLAGAGMLALLYEGIRFTQTRRWQSTVLMIFSLFLVFDPVAAAYRKAPRLSLRDYHQADEFVRAVFQQFEGQGEGAVLLAPWEGVTPLEYTQYVDGRRLDPADVKLVFVASGTANPWAEFVWKHIEDGPIYLADYRPQVAAEGFRLRPVGDWPLFKLEPPPATHVPDIDNPLDLWADDTIQILGWDLDRTSLDAGDTAHLTLYLRVPQELTDYYMPHLWLGDRLYRWTTDSRLNTPWWQPGEVVVERYAITIPFGTPPGDYPLALGISNVSQGEDLTFSDGEALIKLKDSLHVKPPPIAPPQEVLTTALANIDSRVALKSGSASARGRTVTTPWAEPLTVRPGDKLQIWLNWQALASVDQPLTVFVHLIDGSGRLWAQHDYTPMGGAFPTFLWIPRWIEGQAVSDPYTLAVPPDAPPGEYLIEIGMYGMTSLRRAYHFDPWGNLAGDRYIMGAIQVQAP